MPSMNWDRGLPGAFRDVARWFNERRSPYVATRALRELLPGDPQFGDPMSTTGTEPARRLARRAWALNEGRLSLAAELGLAALQVADWLRDDAGSRDGEGEVCILFTDLVGFSSWALTAGDAQSLDLLRRVDAEVTAVVEASGGEVVKRLGDGTMAVFPGDPAAAVKAACTALEAA